MEREQTGTHGPLRAIWETGGNGGHGRPSRRPRYRDTPIEAPSNEDTHHRRRHPYRDTSRNTPTSLRVQTPIAPSEAPRTTTDHRDNHRHPHRHTSRDMPACLNVQAPQTPSEAPLRNTSTQSQSPAPYSDGGRGPSAGPQQAPWIQVLCPCYWPGTTHDAIQARLQAYRGPGDPQGRRRCRRRGTESRNPTTGTPGYPPYRPQHQNSKSPGVVGVSSPEPSARTKGPRGSDHPLDLAGPSASYMRLNPQARSLAEPSHAYPMRRGGHHG